MTELFYLFKSVRHGLWTRIYPAIGAVTILLALTDAAHGNIRMPKYNPDSTAKKPALQNAAKVFQLFHQCQEPVNEKTHIQKETKRVFEDCTNQYLSPQLTPRLKEAYRVWLLEDWQISAVSECGEETLRILRAFGENTELALCFQAQAPARKDGILLFETRGEKTYISKIKL